ncbi:MAG: glycosyltransferase [Fimbriimonadia bacterium]
MEKGTTGGQRIAFLSTYPPRRCGIATFTHDLANAVVEHLPSQENVVAVAITNTDEEYQYPPRVKFEIQQHNLSDYKRAAEFLNYSRVDIISIQHEYGIFGGEWGEYLVTLLRDVRVPVVTTMHTVLEDRRPVQSRVFDAIADRSDKIVVMTNRAVDMLSAQGVPMDKMVYIPHGIPDLPVVDPSYYKDQFELEGRTVLLTFGLIGPGKGIETAIRAVRKVADQHPEVVYMVLGATHPEVVRQSGEAYRLSLERLVSDLGLEDNVVFYNRYVEFEELCEALCAADIYLTPYPNRNQITSGTLAYALGAGKAIVSTPFWHAEELLADGRGLLTEFNDENDMAEKINWLLSNPVEMHAMRKRAYQHGRAMVWREVGKSYVQEFEALLGGAGKLKAATARSSRAVIIGSRSLPEPSLQHLRRLTDRFGLFQHARYRIPDYSHGYCVDDNARALVAATKYYRLFNKPDVLDLLGTFLAFVIYCQNEDGTFRNFLSVERRFLDEVGSDDCQGRALWGLGHTIAYAPTDYQAVAKDAFDLALPNLHKINLRGAAYAMLGIFRYLDKYPGALQLKNALVELAEKLMYCYEQTRSPGWDWFEPVLAYDNGLIPRALWRASQVLGNERYKEVARSTTDWLFEQCTRDGHLSLVGSNGWFRRGDPEKPHFDQQPIDAAAMVSLAGAAFQSTKEERYLKLMRMAYDWFLGANDLQVPMYDFRSGGCSDGLTPNGASANQGAESTLACLHATMVMIELLPEEAGARNVEVAGDGDARSIAAGG